MTSLDPVFRLLVRTLSEQQPDRVHQPIAINQLMDDVLPYRLVRRELGVDSAEDYETLVLRLCSGEGEFVQAEPATQEALLAELRKPLADLALLRVYGDSHIVLRTDPLLTVMEVHPEQRYAPPGQPISSADDDEPTEPSADGDEQVDNQQDQDDEADAWVPDPVFEANASAVTPLEPGAAVIPPAALDKTQARCPFCGGLLPPRMAINFCPHCGMGQDVGTCRACGADMDVGWRFCVSCGEEAQGGLE